MPALSFRCPSPLPRDLEHPHLICVGSRALAPVWHLSASLFMTMLSVKCPSPPCLLPCSALQGSWLPFLLLPSCHYHQENSLLGFKTNSTFAFCLEPGQRNSAECRVWREGNVGVLLLGTYVLRNFTSLVKTFYPMCPLSGGAVTE